MSSPRDSAEAPDRDSVSAGSAEASGSEVSDDTAAMPNPFAADRGEDGQAPSSAPALQDRGAPAEGPGAGPGAPAPSPGAPALRPGEPRADRAAGSGAGTGGSPAGPNRFGPGESEGGGFGPGARPEGGRYGAVPYGPSQATPQPAPAPGFSEATTATTRAQSRPAKRRSRLPLFLALGSVLLVLVLVLVGVLVVNSVNRNDYGPDTVAEGYVTALNSGDFAAAEKIAPSPRPEGTNLDLLSTNFTQASSANIENAKVESSSVDGNTGKVVISYELDGTTYNVDLTARKDGRQNLFFDKWALTGPALHVISLDVPAADGLTINGTEYTAQAGTTAFAVYPGTYDFSLPASKWVSEASDTASANFPQAYAPGSQPTGEQVSPLTLNLDLTPTSAFGDEVQKQVEGELNKCFDNTDITPKCEFIKFDPTQIPVGGTDQKLDQLAQANTAKWTIKEMPKVSASFGAGDTSTGSFFTETDGQFDFSVDGKQSGSSYFSNGNPLSVSGSVKIDGDSLSIEFFDF